MTLPYDFTDSRLHERRERVFLVLAGLFLGTMTMLNILGISRFIDLSFTIFGVRIPMIVAVGVLPYPITFLCTDMISEFYGRARANAVVVTGVLLNIWVVAIFWLGSVLPPAPVIDPATGMIADQAGRVFFEVRDLAMGAVGASMIAFVAAQFCDVYLYHFWMSLTRGKHLWLRNNGSTLVSQLVDTTAVILITYYYAKALPVNESQPILPQLAVFIASGYTFKLVAALLDTFVAYGLVYVLSRYLQFHPRQKYEAVPLAEEPA